MRQRLKALRQKAEKALILKGKRPTKEGGYLPKGQNLARPPKMPSRSILHPPGSGAVPDDRDNKGCMAFEYDPSDRSKEDATLSQIRSFAKEGKGGALLEGANRTRWLFTGLGSDTCFPGCPGGCLHQRHPQYDLCHSEGDHLTHRHSSDGQSSVGKHLYYWAIGGRAKAEATTSEGSKDEGTAEREVETIELDADRG
ncbi:hypothetical protein O6P43_032197 [Quillaja saponaria]|uniref:Uncharacterized protein n=1 Tax=Quillaja saponaria TaxID=32244 RepID=A0AAD7PA67_QUISA|nr:hypothetical protein O6P43_032197 [Quillaja saponaria]